MISPNSSDAPRWNPDTWHISDANPLTPELPHPCTLWRQRGNWEEKEIKALAQDKQRPVLYLQPVATPSPSRQGALEVQTMRPLTAAAQLSPRPRRWTCCKWKEKGAEGRQWASPFLRSTWSARLHPPHTSAKFWNELQRVFPSKTLNKSF